MTEKTYELKITISDEDDVGIDEIIRLVESQNYPNNCIKVVTADSCDWMPIETAPKDGTEILTLAGKEVHNSYFMPNGRWTGWLTPTHWMSLPFKPLRGNKDVQ